jgi:hypothetical protein
MKLMIHELQAMSIAPRIITETNIKNIPVFEYLKNNYNSHKGIDDLYDFDDIIEEE